MRRDGRTDELTIHSQQCFLGLVLEQGALSSLQSRLCAALKLQPYFLFPPIEFLLFSSATSLCVKLGLRISPVIAVML